MKSKMVMPETVAAQAMGWVDEATKAISPAIHTSTTYVRDADNQYRNGRVYARDHNPSFDQVEAVLCELEKGAKAAVFASGMAAATAVLSSMIRICGISCRRRRLGDAARTLKSAHYTLPNVLAGSRDSAISKPGSATR